MTDRSKPPANGGQAVLRRPRSAGPGTCQCRSRRCRENAASSVTSPAVAGGSSNSQVCVASPPAVENGRTSDFGSGSSSNAASAFTCKRRSCAAAALAFMRTFKKTQPGSIFSHCNCWTLMGSLAAAAMGSLPANVEAVARPKLGDPARRNLFPADRAQCRRDLDRRAARRHGDFQPRRGHAGNGQLETGGMAVGRTLRPQCQFQAILARLGNVQQQGAAVGVPVGLDRPVVQLRLVRHEADFLAAKRNAHPRRRVEDADFVFRREAIDNVSLQCAHHRRAPRDRRPR